LHLFGKERKNYKGVREITACVEDCAKGERLYSDGSICICAQSVEEETFLWLTFLLSFLRPISLMGHWQLFYMSVCTCVCLSVCVRAIRRVFGDRIESALLPSFIPLSSAALIAVLEFQRLPAVFVCLVRQDTNGGIEETRKGSDIFDRPGAINNPPFL